MLGAMIMVLGIAFLVYCICVNIALGGLGGGCSPGGLIVMTLCVGGIFTLLWFAPQLVNMKIGITF